MIAPDLEFQGLIYDTLVADADVMAIATGVYDDVPAAALYPFVTIGASDDNATDSQCITASEYNFTVHVWSQKKPKLECRNLRFAVKKALHNQKLTLTVHAISNIRAASGRITSDPDGSTHHGTVQVSAIIEEK